MIVGILSIEAHLPSAVSLKDKRQVVQSLKQRLRNQFNVAVAEVGHQELHQRAAIGIVSVAGNRRIIENELRRVLSAVEARDDLTVTQHDVEYL